VHPAIHVEHVSKRYRLGSRATATGRLTESLWRGAASLFSRQASTKQRGGTIWALRDVCFDVEPAEVLGVVGQNGAGKSTLLKILSRITTPTEGYTETYGRVSSLLEVGTGFHPELTGRENISLNGAILGMRRAEIRRRFDEIVDFSEIAEFIDTPVKRYSSGMYMRLAFAVAAHMQPEILLVDEVLAVGDAAFQRKCLGKMGDVAHDGRTVVFVSHNMGAIRSLCTRAILIERGRLAADGAPESITSAYLEATSSGRHEVETASLSGDLVIEEVTFVVNGLPSGQLKPGDSLTVQVKYSAERRIDRPQLAISIVSRFGPVIGANMVLDGTDLQALEGQGTLACTFESLPLLPQTYSLRLAGRRGDGLTPLFDPPADLGAIHVTGLLKDHGLSGEIADSLAENSTPVVVPYTWELPDGTTVRVPGFARPQEWNPLPS
jgi:lipopolysaccharide transport system ATP-binding protein